MTKEFKQFQLMFGDLLREMFDVLTQEELAAADDLTFNEFCQEVWVALSDEYVMVFAI